MLDDAEPVLDSSEGCTIDWLPGKNCTVKVGREVGWVAGLGRQVGCLGGWLAGKPAACGKGLIAGVLKHASWQDEVIPSQS